MQSGASAPVRTRSRLVVRRAGLFVALLLLLALLAFQAWAYHDRITLSLGPRVILEPWLLGRGEVFYETVADLHTPLMPLSLAWLAPLVPGGLARARLALAALLTLTTLLTFIAAWRRIGWAAGLWAAGFLVVWSIRFGFPKLWHESFLAPLYLLLFLSYRSCLRRGSAVPLLLAGFLGGLAVLVKQHALLVLAGFAAWTAFTRWITHRSVRALLRDLVPMGTASLVPLAAFALYQYARAGTLAGFFYWTVGYGLTGEYGSLAAQAPTQAQLLSLGSACLLLPVALAGFVHATRAQSDGWKTAGLALVLLVASAATAYPRYNPFHLQASLPLLAWLSAWGLAWLWRLRGAWRGLAWGAGLSLSILWLVTAGAAYRPALRTDFRRTIIEYSDLVPLAREVRQATGPGECVYLFPDDEATANLYYLLDCPTPSFWIFHYPWYLTGPIRERILATLHEQPPEWVVYFPGRWGAEELAPDIMDYLQDHYRQEAGLQWAQGEVQLLGPRER
jgi:hypothetical protein